MPESQTSHYHVFLSHNSRDKVAVELLAGMLKQQGLNPFLDKWNLVPGEPIEDGLRRALENSESAVIFVGPDGDGPWQSEEMRDILKRAVKSHNEFRAIPALLPNASAAALEKSFLGSRLWIEFKSVDDADALMRLTKAIQGEASGGDSLKLPDEPAPYRGLERFERIEKPEEDFFFGRDEEIRALVGRLVKERFVAVVGASGSGKSSLVRAGLTKQLAEDIHPGIRRWTTITVEPGSAPFRSLAIQIAVAAGIPVADRERWIEQTVEKWTAAPDGVRQTVETLFADAKETLLIFIDQFEELFTHRLEGPESDSLTRNFVANLADLWRNRGDRVRVAMALRADFVARCLEIGPLKELLQDHTMLVGEVGDDALREIVKEPAARVGAFLQKGLMERILKDVRSGSGSLPLLQQALHGLWRNRTGPWLTHDAYTASGGVARALNDQAQAAFKALDDGQKTIADSLFLRLITLGEGMADTRRRVKRSELYPRDVDPDAVNTVIDRLSGKDARILVTTRAGGKAEDLASGEDFVEFTHEALLSNWKHLVELLETERTSIRRHRGLEAAAAEWQSKSDDQRQKFLLRSGQLIIAEDWATSQGGNERMTELEALFLKASTDERDAEEDRKAKVDRRLKFLSIGATAAAIIAMVIGGFAFQQKEKAIAGEKKAAAARDAAKEAETKTGQIASHSEYLRGCELIASGNEDRALKSFAQALHSSPDNREAATRLISLLGQRFWPRLIAPPLHLANRVECLAATPDGRHLFVATDQPRSGDAYSMSAVQAYDLGSLKLMVKPKIDPEDAIEAPIGKLAVNATGDRIMAVRSRYNPIRPGAIELFDANSGRMINFFEATNADGDELLDKCFFSNDGRYMLYSQRVYDRHPDERPAVNVVSATTGSSIRTIQLENSGSPTPVVTADIIEGTIYILDNHGRVFMQALSDNSSPHVYHLNLPQDDKADKYVWASVSPDGRSLFGLFKSKDSVWYVGRWRLGDGRIEHVWSRGYDQGQDIGEVFQWDANFNAAGQLTLVGSQESEKSLIVLEAGSDPQDDLTEKKLPGGKPTLILPQNSFLTADGNVAHKNSFDGGTVSGVMRHDGAITAVCAIGNDGFATGTADGEVKIWRLMPTCPLITTSTFDTEHKRTDDADEEILDVSNDGSAELHRRNGSLVLIRKENGKPRELHGPWEDEAIKDDRVLCDACFAQDGKRFAVVTVVHIGNREGNSDYRARIFSTIDGSELVPPLQLQRRGFDDVRAIFTRDGKQLITLSEDELRFWDLSTKSYPKKVLVQPDAQWVQVGQVGQKQIFVTLSGDGSGIVWNAKTRSQLQTLEPLHDIKDFTIRPVLSEDCRRLAAAFGNKIVIWDVDDGRLLSDPIDCGDIVNFLKFPNGLSNELHAQLQNGAEVVWKFADVSGKWAPEDVATAATLVEYVGGFMSPEKGLLAGPEKDPNLAVLVNHFRKISQEKTLPVSPGESSKKMELEKEENTEEATTVAPASSDQPPQSPSLISPFPGTQQGKVRAHLLQQQRKARQPRESAQGDFITRLFRTFVNIFRRPE